MLITFAWHRVLQYSRFFSKVDSPAWIGPIMYFVYSHPSESSNSTTILHITGLLRSPNTVYNPEVSLENCFIVWFHGSILMVELPQRRYGLFIYLFIPLLCCPSQRLCDTFGYFLHRTLRSILGWRDSWTYRSYLLTPSSVSFCILYTPLPEHIYNMEHQECSRCEGAVSICGKHPPRWL